MYIQSMQVYKLHKVYNYDIQFNEDITILYGENGSGKTTILSILESILTANIWQLFQYDFSSVILKGNEKITIEVFRGIDRENGLYLDIKIIDNSKAKTTSDKIFQNVISSVTPHEYAQREIEKEIHSVYPVIEKLDDLFNDLYLPVNRLSSSAVNLRNPYKNHQNIYDNDIDNSLEIAIDLISREIRIIESRKNRYNQQFKNEILLSTLDVVDEKPLNLLLSSDVVDLNKVNELQNKYVKMLENLEIKGTSNNIESFFENYKKNLPSILAYISEWMKSNDSTLIKNENQIDLMKFFLEASEIIRMKKTLPIAENLEKRLSDISLKINTFVNIVNSYFEDSMERKEIMFDTLGRPYFKIDGRSDKIPLTHLSSGEKQIIILFANLVLTKKYSGKKLFRDIFIADEPEISLHMLWQMKLIPNMLKSRKKLQIILATHSPEIVGEYENKMFELKKERVGYE